VVATAAVMLGTLYPLVLGTLGLGKISVGPPYFDTVFFPLMAPALFLMGIGPLARWKRTELPDLAGRLRWAVAVGVLASLLAPAVAALAGVDGPAWRPLTSLGLLLAAWIAATVAIAVRDMLRGPDGRPRIARLRLHAPSTWAMHLAHLGVAVFIVGVTLSNSYTTDRELRMELGQQVSIAGYTLRFVELASVPGPNYDAVRGLFEVRRSAGASDGEAAGRPITELSPEKRLYRASGQTMTEAAIDRGLLRDVYVSMGEALDDRTWVVRAHVKPFINWIWLGCLLMSAGGFTAVADRRYRRASGRAEARHAGWSAVT